VIGLNNHFHESLNGDSAEASVDVWDFLVSLGCSFVARWSSALLSTDFDSNLPLFILDDTATGMNCSQGCLSSVQR